MCILMYMRGCYGVLNLHAKLTIKKMSRNFNSLYVVNFNLNFVSVTQSLTDHNIGTVKSVEVSEVSFESLEYALHDEIKI